MKQLFTSANMQAQSGVQVSQPSRQRFLKQFIDELLTVCNQCWRHAKHAMLHWLSLINTDTAAFNNRLLILRTRCPFYKMTWGQVDQPPSGLLVPISQSYPYFTMYFMVFLYIFILIIIVTLLFNKSEHLRWNLLFRKITII